MEATAAVVLADASNAPPMRPPKPDRAAYDAEQVRLCAEIEAAKTHLFAAKEKIRLLMQSSAGERDDRDRRNILRAELNTLRETQAINKAARRKIISQLETLRNSIRRKKDALRSAQEKTIYRTVDEFDIYMRDLTEQVKAGKMTIVDDKKAVREINQEKQTRKIVASFRAQAQAIEADQATTDELQRQLDDPEAERVSMRYDTIKAELNEMHRRSSSSMDFGQFVHERHTLQCALDSLQNQQQESSRQYNEARVRHKEFHAKAKEAQDAIRRAKYEARQKHREYMEEKRTRIEKARQQFCLICGRNGHPPWVCKATTSKIGQPVVVRSGGSSKFIEINGGTKFCGPFNVHGPSGCYGHPKRIKHLCSLCGDAGHHAAQHAAEFSGTAVAAAAGKVSEVVVEQSSEAIADDSESSGRTAEAFSEETVVPCTVRAVAD
ncbi:hypothetical protein BV25DRAFT_1827909 [Artomyces pyxidatus]|uniref:Uncharacterized protein n=1 Tax=Artomyces pyxidatus TaxID=48021 RepID=A0ACB8SWW9_9AGAM|nr:hypothetical protein BV25DRAFT_1827909 [Artomyces pyxidatus]